ncbi:MAG: two-component regulator propeller domain-containing protein [bacterium]
MLALPAAAQTTIGLDPRKPIGQYILEKWQTEQGLPQGSVNAVAQTADGYVWIASQVGLTRFDGVALTTFSARNTPGLKDMHITALHVDRHGTMWIGTVLSGVSMLRDGRFTPIEGDLPTAEVLCFFEDRAGTIWEGTRAGLSRFARGRFRPVPNVSAAVQALAEDEDGSLLLGTDHGLLRYADGRVSSGRAGEVRVDSAVSALLRDRQGALWIGLSGGVVRLEAGDATHFTSRDGFPAGLVHSIVQDHAGTIWIGSDGGGIARLRDERFEVFSSVDGLLGDVATAILEDREGSLWVGTRDGGLNRFRDAQFATYGQREGLPANVVWAVYGDRDGSILLGAERSGLTRFANGKFTTVGTKDGLNDADARTILRTSSGDLWVGTKHAVLRQRRDGSWENMTIAGRVPEGTPRALFEDHAGVLWIGGAFGLIRYENGEFHQQHFEPGRRVTVWTIAEDAAGAIWIGGGEGVVRLVGDAFTSFTTKEGLSNNVVESIYASREGVWVGSRLGELDLIRGNKISRVPVTHVSMVDPVSITEDRRGMLWLSSSQGLYSVSKQQLISAADGSTTPIDFRRYELLDGLHTTDFNGAGLNSVARTADGRLWYPTGKGLVVVEPNRWATNTVPPGVHLERLVVDGSDAVPTDGMEILPSGSKLEFHYSATSLLIPARVAFRYKLEGYDTEWVEAGARRVAYYTGVPAGKYTFRVVAANNDGLWNDRGVSLAFAKLPHLYETSWFYLLCGAGLVGAAVGVFHLRVRSVQQRARELATLVDERTIALRTSEERYRSLFDANPQPVWVHDVETLAFLAVNPAAMSHYGYSAEEFSAMTLADISCSDPAPTESGASAIESWRDKPIRRHCRKDSGVIEVEVDEHAIDFGGRRAQLSVISDVTARRDLEERLRQAQKMEAVGQLAGGIAHDLNNVLTAVMAHVDLAVSTLPPDCISVGDLTQAQAAAHRGATMIRKLLGFSRRERLVLKPLDLGSLTRELAATITRMLPSNIVIAMTQTPELSPVAADAGAVQQIVLNLATNARDAMSEGGTLQIDVTAVVLDETSIATFGWGTPGNYVVLSVTDNGEGMQPETLGRVFEPYFSTKGEGRGSGLGMAMVYGLVKQHMGYVHVDSQPSAGTKVSLYFPASLEAAPALAMSTPVVGVHADETILLVEDEDAVRTAATRALTRQGYRVLTAKNGSEGLEIWRANADEIDLVVSDSIMPGMSGQAMFAAIRKERTGVRMLLMSGYSGEEVLRSSPASADVPFLPKPWTVRELTGRVREVLALGEVTEAA